MTLRMDGNAFSPSDASELESSNASGTAVVVRTVDHVSGEQLLLTDSSAANDRRGAEHRVMPERRDVSASIETSDDYIPDFRKIVDYGRRTLSGTLKKDDEKGSRIVTTADDAEVVVTLEKFRKILSHQSFDPLLLELAIVHERKLDSRGKTDGAAKTVDNGRNQHFTSFMASYLGRFDNKPLIIECWNEAIDKLLRPSKDGLNQRYSLMAYEQTYESSYLAEQFNWAVLEMRRARMLPAVYDDQSEVDALADKLVDARSQVFGKLKRVYDALEQVFTMPAPNKEERRGRLDDYIARVSEENGVSVSPTVYRKVYPFSLIPRKVLEEKHSVDVEGAVSYLVAQFVSRIVSLTQNGYPTESVKALLDFLVNCCLLIVPFRRPVAYDPRVEVEHDFSWGDSPGGCLFAIVRPRFGSMATDTQLDDLSRRFITVLSRAALRESHVTAKVEAEMHQHKEELMRLLSHHLPTSIKNIIGNLDVALAGLEGMPQANSVNGKLKSAHKESEELLEETDLMIHAYKVEVGALSPRPLEHSKTAAKICELISDTASDVWSELHKGGGLKLPVTLTPLATASSELRVAYDPLYIRFTIKELIRNVNKHGTNQTPNISVEIHGSDAFVVVSNDLRHDANSFPKSRLGLTQLDYAAIAYGLITPNCRIEPGSRRFVARLPINKLKQTQDEE